MRLSNHRHSPHGCALLVLTVLVATRCGGNEANPSVRDPEANAGPSVEDPEADSAPSIEGLETVAKFEAARVAAYCEQMARCCNDAGTALSFEACEGQLGQYNGTLERPTLRYDAQAARGCIDAYAGLVSSSCEVVGANAVGSACRGVVVGTVARGERCGDDRDCAPVGIEPSRCNITFDAQPPVPPYCGPDPSRAVRRHLNEGDACSGQCADNPRGSRCPGAADEPMCFLNDGLQCKDGTCAPLDPDGSACVVAWSCRSGQCFFPDFTSGVGVCRTAVALDDCREDYDCPPGHFCRRLLNTMVNGMIVEGGVRCEPRFVAGTACSEDRECASNNCTTVITRETLDPYAEGVCRGELRIPACLMFSIYPFIP